MNNPFDYVPDDLCREAMGSLFSKLEKLSSSDVPEEIAFSRELASGKMLGVLIAADSVDVRHTLYAFSGQIGDVGFHYPGFAEPVFDYLTPDGYFRKKEAEISGLNAEIAVFKKEILAGIRAEHDREKKRLYVEIEKYKEKCRISKLEREAIRASGQVDEIQTKDMIRQSQFEKAELRRLKKRMEQALAPFVVRLKEAESRLEAYKEKRRSESEALQRWLFTNFRLLNARGESLSLSEIFAETTLRVPPSGAGECCAPKLLQAAYMRGWKPLSIAEYWYGSSKGGDVRIAGNHYPACRGKCLPVLNWMLQGLDVEPPLDSDCCHTDLPEPEIIYENEWFCVVDKPSGMLSVPGKGRDISVQQWLASRYGAEKDVRMAHRLDQDTSGLLIATFGRLAFKQMQFLFATRKISKTYVADVEGDYKARGIARKGRIELPLSHDWLDRPRQRVDFSEGKPAVTEYEFISSSEDLSRVIFRPLTGRTHQLRVHAASESGLGMPISGDRLYGTNKTGAGRLRLHAHRLEFSFPEEGEAYSFESPVPFS